MKKDSINNENETPMENDTKKWDKKRKRKGKKKGRLIVLLLILLLLLGFLIGKYGFGFGGFGDNDGQGENVSSNETQTELVANTKKVSVSVVENDYLYENQKLSLDELMLKLKSLEDFYVEITNDNAALKTYNSLTDELKRNGIVYTEKN